MKDEMVKMYKHQLKFGCKRPSCTKIFCKATSDDSVAETVASILSLYSDDFLCENITKSFINIQDNREFKNGGFWCTDMLLFYLNLFQTKKNDVLFFKNCSKNISEKAPYDLEDDVDNLEKRTICENTPGSENTLGTENTLGSENTLNNVSMNIDLKDTKNCNRIPDKLANLEMKFKNITFDCESSHKFCKYFNKENVSQEEIIVLTGVVGILIRKYDKIPHYTLGLLIIRIINLLGDKVDFSIQQISTIHNIYFNIRLVGINMKNGVGLNSSNERDRHTRRPTFHESNNYNQKKSKMDSSEQSNSLSEEYEQCSILISTESPGNTVDTQHIAPEFPINDRPPLYHNVLLNTDFELSAIANPVQISPVMDTQIIVDESFYSIIKNSCIEEEGCYRNIYINNNTKYTCLNSTLFNRNDLIRSVCTFSSHLNSAIVIDIRENKKIEISLNIFHLLYLMNEEVLILGYKRFYLPDFCAKMNFKEEFKFYRMKSKTPLKYSFILPVHIKAELIKAETNDMMKSSLQDSFFRALFEGHIGPYLFITVSRDNIYKESMDIVRCLNIEDVRKQLRITFKGEEGVDSGGIRKEFFQLLSHEIKHDENLFHNHENIIWLRNDCLDMSAYTTIGRILGIALYNNVLLNIPFPSVFFKKLLNKKTTFYDLKEIDPELFISLSNLKKLSEFELANLALTFTINYTSSKNKMKMYNLTEDKFERFVTKDNLNSFVNRYADFYINRSIYRQFEAIKKGFLFVIERETLFYLDHKELEKIIMGSNEFDVHALRSTASYTDYTCDSKIINWFWEIFESYGKKMRKKLLQFITGNDRIPVAGAASVKLIIMKNGCDTDRLPSSQTCFNTLLLPEYSSKKKLESKLRTALEMTAGFYLL